MATGFDANGFIFPDEVREFLRSEEAVAAKLEVAERARDYAKSIAPVDESGKSGHRVPGTYRDRIEVLQRGKRVLLSFSDGISNIIEYGSEDTPEFGVLRRTEEYINEGTSDSSWELKGLGERSGGAG